MNGLIAGCTNDGIILKKLRHNKAMSVVSCEQVRKVKLSLQCMIFISHPAGTEDILDCFQNIRKHYISKILTRSPDTLNFKIGAVCCENYISICQNVLIQLLFNWFGLLCGQ